MSTDEQRASPDPPLPETPSSLHDTKPESPAEATPAVAGGGGGGGGGGGDPTSSTVDSGHVQATTRRSNSATHHHPKYIEMKTCTVGGHWLGRGKAVQKELQKQCPNATIEHKKGHLFQFSIRIDEEPKPVVGATFKDGFATLAGLLFFVRSPKRVVQRVLLKPKEEEEEEKEEEKEEEDGQAPKPPEAPAAPQEKAASDPGTADAAAAAAPDEKPNSEP